MDQGCLLKPAFFEDTINELQAGDELGVFDLAGILPNSDCGDESYGELLVGAGVWSNSQLEIIPIGSSTAPCLGGGDVLPGLVIYTTSSPTNRKDNALRLQLFKLPLAACAVLK